MNQKKYYYLIHIQYLGFRFHGWAKQKGLKTVHLMIDKTINFILDHDNFKTMGTSRTDAMVSANHSAFELFMNEPIENIDLFFNALNLNLPSDINAIKIEEVDAKFNIINSSEYKKYTYLFSYGNKQHPFSSALMCNIQSHLNIEKMKIAAQMFVGNHNFKNYCTKPTEGKDYQRTILESYIEKNTTYKANFFPEKSFIYTVKGKGFLRNQIRLMMGQLISIGKNESTLEYLETSLITPHQKQLNYIAPASGLILDEIKFNT